MTESLACVYRCPLCETKPFVRNQTFQEGGGEKGTILFLEVDFFEGIRTDSFISHIEVDCVEKTEYEICPSGQSVSTNFVTDCIICSFSEPLFSSPSFFQRVEDLSHSFDNWGKIITSVSMIMICCKYSFILDYRTNVNIRRNLVLRTNRKKRNNLAITRWAKKQLKRGKENQSWFERVKFNSPC